MHLSDVDEIPFQLLHPAARPPVRTRPGDAGLDLYGVKPVDLAPGARARVPTGVAVALPPGLCGLVVPRSGLAANHGVAPLTGLIDPNFRGEIAVTLLNTSAERFRADAGDRVAQLLLVPFRVPALRLVERLPDSTDDRGARGWGSSGA